MIRPRVLFTAINRQGGVFLWPANLPGTDGKLDDWSRSALEAANPRPRAWVRVVADMSLGAYQVFEAGEDLPNPTWPETPFGELLRIGFRDRLVDSLDHAVLRKLRGEL